MPSPNNSAASQVLERKEFLIHEYDALRSQILKQIEVGYQLVNFVLTIFGAVLALKLANVSVNALPLLVYPIVALALARGWHHADARAREIGTYIKKNIESVVQGDKIGWEHYLEKTPVPDRWYRELVMLIFLGTEFLAGLVAILSQPSPLTSPIGIIFLVIALLSFFLTIVMFLKDLLLALLSFFLTIVMFLKDLLKVLKNLDLKNLLKELPAWCNQKFFIYFMSYSELKCLGKIASLYEYYYNKSDQEIEDQLKYLNDHGFIESTEHGKKLAIIDLQNGNLVDTIRPTLLGWVCITLRGKEEKVKKELNQQDTKNVKEYVWEVVREEVDSPSNIPERIAKHEFKEMRVGKDAHGSASSFDTSSTNEYKLSVKLYHSGLAGDKSGSVNKAPSPWTASVREEEAIYLHTEFLSTFEAPGCSRQLSGTWYLFGRKLTTGDNLALC